MQDQTKGIIYSAITAFFWGLLAIALKVAVQEVDPKTIVWLRFFIAFLFILGWQLYQNPRALKIMISPPLLLVIAAIALSWNYLGFMLGIHYTTPSNAQLFIQFGPNVAGSFRLFIFKERFSRIQMAGFLIALFGFAFFYGDQLLAFFEGKKQYNIGCFIYTQRSSGMDYLCRFAKNTGQAIILTPMLNLFLFGFPAFYYTCLL
jgi:drug/metabolite transporter (DMT)-like permease